MVGPQAGRGAARVSAVLGGDDLIFVESRASMLAVAIAGLGGGRWRQHHPRGANADDIAAPPPCAPQRYRRRLWCSPATLPPLTSFAPDSAAAAPACLIDLPAVHRETDFPRARRQATTGTHALIIPTPLPRENLCHIASVSCDG